MSWGSQMKRMISALCALTATAFIAGAATAEPLTSEAIVELTKTGLGDEAIVAKIKSDGTVFDLSTEQMIDLRK